MQWKKIDNTKSPAEVLAERDATNALRLNLIIEAGQWFEVTGLAGDFQGLDVNPLSIWSVLADALGRQGVPDTAGRFEVEPVDSEAMTPNPDSAKARYVIDE